MNAVFIVGVILAEICLLAVLAIPVILIFRRSYKNRQLKLTLYVFGLIFIFRFLVGLADSLNSGGLTVWETVFDSVIHALQTFSLDEDYTSYTMLGKELLLEGGHPVCSAVYGFTISFLNMCAPVLGGAVVLDILINIFPSIKIALMKPFRHSFVFSEMNEEAVTLAEDLVINDNYKECREDTPVLRGRLWNPRPLIIFTDAYKDEESEPRSELFERAKALGGICVRTDLQHLSFRRSKSVDYFLMDKDSRGNIGSLSHLLEKQGPQVRIFFFQNSAMDGYMVQHLREKHKEAADKVIIRMVDDYRNAAVNLMYQAPLFLPLMGRGDEGKALTMTEGKALTVTIIGGGAIAEEVFKAVFWCAQMLDAQLVLRVLSRDADEFQNRIYEECPELQESCCERSPLLKVYPEGDTYNPPYAGLSFITVQDAEMLTLYPKEILEDTDYYVVALGDDGRNIAVSDKLRRHCMKKLKDRGCARPVIAPAVYDKAMASAVRNADPGPYEPYMLPFAGLTDRFSCRNVFLNDFTATAFSSAGLYSKKEQDKVFKDEYSYWANIARSVHAPYKLFSAGRILSVNLESDAVRRFEVDKTPLVAVKLGADNDSEDGGKRTKAEMPGEPKPEDFISSKERQRLAWLEHRRWNAFMRSQGFTKPSLERYETYFSQDHTHKNVKLKLHNCLVESDGSSEGKQLPTEDLYLQGKFSREDYDALDQAAMSAYDMERKYPDPRKEDKKKSADKDKNKGGDSSEKTDPLQEMDYKIWDYYNHDAAFLILLMGKEWVDRHTTKEGRIEW